jgi:hypothetical protein
VCTSLWCWNGVTGWGKNVGGGVEATTGQGRGLLRDVTVTGEGVWDKNNRWGERV